MVEQHDPDCFYGLKIPTRYQQAEAHFVKNINSSIMLFGGMMIQVPSPHASSSLYLLGFKIHF